MQSILNQFLQLLQQGIAFIFRIIGQAWSWAIGEFIKITQVPFGSLSIYKWVVIVATIVGVAYFLYRAGRELLDTMEKLLKAFAAALSSLVTSLP